MDGTVRVVVVGLTDVVSCIGKHIVKTYISISNLPNSLNHPDESGEPLFPSQFPQGLGSGDLDSW